jgi:glycosyltransferase involved in cell wall biosynthesis
MPVRRPERIHQLLASVTVGDAISDEAFEIRHLLRRAGFESEIFCDRIHPKLMDEVYHFEDYMEISGPEELFILHYSIGTDVSKLAYHIPDRKILIYHNITPWQYVVGLHDSLPRQLFEGRKELATFADRTVLALGDSEYNRRELEELGFHVTGVMPIPVNFERFDGVRPDPVTLKAFSDHRINILFVGRVIPNKKLEDVILTYAHYKKFVSHDSRLIFVGEYGSFPSYRKLLAQLVAEIDLPEVVFTGHVTFPQLVAFYKIADVFLCMSEHEGFCVPLLEAMHFDVPVIAYDVGPIPDTMGGAGVLVKRKNYAEIAEMIDLLARDEFMRKRIIAGQRARLKKFRRIPYDKILLGHVERALELISGGGR